VLFGPPQLFRATMINLDRCLESLAFCHVQDDLLWASARIVAQQDIDEFLSGAGSDLAGQLAALQQLMQGFDAKFPGQTDPVLIRSTMRRHLRRIEFDLKREGDQRRQFHELAELTEAPTAAPEVHEAHHEATVAPEAQHLHEEHQEATVAPEAPDVHAEHQDATVAPDVPGDVAADAKPLPEKDGKTGA
jgi:hypothetical protein